MPIIPEERQIQRRGFERLLGAPHGIELLAKTARAADLQAPLPPAPAGGVGDTLVHFRGLLVVSISPALRVLSDRTLVAVVASCTVVGSTDTVFDVLHNGIELAGDLELPAGDLVERIDVPSTGVAADVDFLTFAVTAAGVGCTDFVVAPVWS